jgi:hypothetical protein
LGKIFLGESGRVFRWWRFEPRRFGCGHNGARRETGSFGKGLLQNKLYGFALPRIGGHLYRFQRRSFGGCRYEHRFRRIVLRPVRRRFFVARFENWDELFGWAFGVRARNRKNTREDTKERNTEGYGYGYRKGPTR